MRAATDERTGTDPTPSRLGFGLLAAGLACLVAAGGLLWWRRGAAVFSDVVLSALAWCF